jgi:ectoine hydroxylase-related dioxygenase (phytanoyl-CoA dioxygenase family)
VRYELTPDEIESYRVDGFVVIEDFLDPAELEDWRGVVGRAVAERAGRKFANQDVLIGEDDGINPDAEYYGKVFDQLLNLWQTNPAMKERILDPRIGEMAARLADVDGLRVWHDQALIKQPWANPTGFHLDTPFWSFSDRRAISIWIALDDATAENGCLYFFAGSHRETTFENPGITKNLDAIFDMYPAFRNRAPIQASMPAGSCSFHNGMTIHGAGANMTNRARRAMTCAFMPDGARFNGQQNILTDEQMARLTVGAVLADDDQNPLVYSAAAAD